MKNIDRRNFIKLVLAGGATAAMPGCAVRAVGGAKAARPNFIVFLADDLGYGDLACYGNPIIKTPNLDRFAGQGMRFTDCHAGGTVCSPSRAALLTGRNPYRIGFYYILGAGAHLRREEITIASLLREQGYDTCFVGKWHLTNIDNKNSGQPHPGDHGFDHWFATQVNAFDGPENPGKFIRNGQKVGPLEGWYCDLIVQEAIDWLKNRTNKEKPFFLFVCSHEPHTPIAPPEKYSQMYDNPEVDKLEKTIQYGRVDRPERDISHLKKLYYGTVTQLDNAFGTLMRAIDDANLKDNTLVYFTSDNGPETPVAFLESQNKWNDPIRDKCFGTPGQLRGMKRYTYEGGHRVAGIARWPGRIQPGSTSDKLINGTDFLPTLCELAGAAVPTDRPIDGASMTPIFNGRDIKRNIPQCWMFPSGYPHIPQMAMRQGDYVLIARFGKKQDGQSPTDWIKTAHLEQFELYNLRTDIAQMTDRTSQEPKRLKTMTAEMRKLWREIQAEGPRWEKAQ